MKKQPSVRDRGPNGKKGLQHAVASSFNKCSQFSPFKDGRGAGLTAQTKVPQLKNLRPPQSSQGCQFKGPMGVGRLDGSFLSLLA